MKVTQVWELEQINWIDPTSSQFRRAYKERSISEPLGLTPNQRSHRAGSRFQVLEFVSPQRFIDIVDPLFEPHGRKTINFLRGAVEQDLPFAPLQVWLGFYEYAHWPHPDGALPWSRQDIRLRAARGEPVSREEHIKIVRQHEGRHRAWLARELGETEVPVTVWVGQEDIG